MDGDEHGQQSGGVAVCDLGSEAGAVASGATAPVASEEELPVETAETAPSEGVEVSAVPEVPAADAAAPDEADEPVGADDAVSADPVDTDVADVADVADVDQEPAGVPDADIPDPDIPDADVPTDSASDVPVDEPSVEVADIHETDAAVGDDVDGDHAEIERAEVDSADVHAAGIRDAELSDTDVHGVVMVVFDPPAVTWAAAAFDPPEVTWAAAAPAPEAEPGPPRYSAYLRRGVAAVVAAGFVASAVTAFTWIAPSPEAANQRFVAAVQSEGRVVASAGQQSLLVTAARKICDRKDVAHTSDRDRRATALTREEIGAVGAAFGADTRDFTELALRTYCSR